MKVFITIVLIAGLGLGLNRPDAVTIVEGDLVASTLMDLGMSKPSHYIENLDSETIQKGYELVHEGRTTHNGKKSKYISKYFKCTSCHNTIREDASLQEVNPLDRLSFAIEKNIPYLQGSTFWGITNRMSWYNDDYYKKYGALVDKARNSLEESTQLCAEVCSQGRPLEEWEMNAILSYYWSLQLKMSDLNPDEDYLKSLSNYQEKIKYIQGLFQTKVPATFVDPPKDKSTGYGLKGNISNGEAIYTLACQHCHREGGESDVVLDNGITTFKWLRKNITKDSPLSIYEIIRKGTYSELGHKEYMPHYTKEKMSDQQVEDLRAYIEKMAN